MGDGVTIYGYTKAGVPITNKRLADLLSGNQRAGRPFGSRNAATREVAEIDRLYRMGAARRLRTIGSVQSPLKTFPLFWW